MAAIQVVSARIGRVSGQGLAGNIRRHYPAWLLYAIVMLLLVANTINIAADASAMGDAAKLLPVDPIKALFWSAVLNGVIAVPIMVVMMLMVCNAKVMGQFVAKRRFRWGGWAATAVMAIAVAAMFATSF